MDEGIQQKKPVETEPVDEEEQSLRVTSISCSMDPDVTIVVGGKEFLEYSQSLCCWSGYFDAALRSGMKESGTKNFQFPEKDPEEWQLVVSLASPFSNDELTKDNVLTVLPWFDELNCTRALKRCDEVLCPEQKDWKGLTKLSPEKARLEFGKQMDSVFETLSPSLRYNLTNSTNKCFANIIDASEKAPALFDVGTIDRVLALVASNQDCKTALWGSLEKHLPDSAKSKGVDVLLQSDLLAALLHSGMLRMNKTTLKRKLDKVVDRVCKVVNNEDGLSCRFTLGLIREKLKTDAIWGDLLQEGKSKKTRVGSIEC